MNIFKALFGTQEETAEDKKRDDAAKQFDVLKFDGVRALKGHQPAYAVQCLTRAIELNDDDECHDYLSQALIQTGDLATAYEQLAYLAQKQPDIPQIYIRMADVSYMLEDYSTMLNDCEKALRIDYTNPYVYLLYARAYRGQGADKNAEDMLTKAIALQDDFYDAYLMRGELRLANGNVEAASEDAQTLSVRITDNEDVLLLSARIEVAKKELDAAIKIYDKVMDVNPFCAAALRERAAAKYSLGRHEEAEADLKEAEELEPKNADGTPSEPQSIEEQVKQIYKNVDPYGLFSHI